MPLGLPDSSSLLADAMVGGSRAGWPATADSDADIRFTDAQIADFTARFGDSAAIAVVGLDGEAPQFVGDVRTPFAMSTAKLLVVAALLGQVGGPANLTEDERVMIADALAASDNDAAASLFTEIETARGSLDAAIAALGEVLGAAGDASTQVVAADAYTVGETVWPLPTQASFLASVRRGCVLTPESQAFILEQMGTVIPEQQWGLGAVGASAFKGGWDYDDAGNAYVRQVGVVTAPDGHDYAVALSARLPTMAGTGDEEWLDTAEIDPFDVDFARTQLLADELAEWVTTNVSAAPPASSC